MCVLSCNMFMLTGLPDMAFAQCDMGIIVNVIDTFLTENEGDTKTACRYVAI